MSKKKLIVKVNLWPPQPNTNGELPISGRAVHPAAKSDAKDFHNANELIGFLKDWNKANRAWDVSSKTIKTDPRGLVFFLTLEPHDDNQHELQGMIKHGENEALFECFCSDKKLIDIIDRWNGEKLQ